MKKILFVITIGVLTTQGCTVYVGPAERSTRTHAPSVSVSDAEHQGVAGPEGIQGPEESVAGAEGEAGELMGKSSVGVPPHSLRPHTHAPAPDEPKSFFGGRFWEGVVAGSATTVVPMIVGALLK